MNKQDRLIIIITGLLIVDTIIGGPLGLFFRGERHLLLAALVMSAIYGIITRPHKLPLNLTFANIYLWPAFFFGISLIWVFIVPLVSGSEFRLAVQDAQSLILLPFASLLFYAATDLKSMARILLKIVVVVTACLALFQLAIWLWLELFSPLSDVPRSFLVWLFNTDKSIFVTYSRSGGGYVRVFWISSIWIVMAIFTAPLVIKRRFNVIAIEFILGAAAYVSYTRGIWLGVFSGAVVCTILLFIMPLSKLEKERWGCVLAGLILAAAVISSIDYFARGQYGFLSRVTYVEQDDSGFSARMKQSLALLKMWEQRPLFGWGYGAYDKSNFSDPHAPFSYEMLPVALLMKLGIIGFLCYVLFWAGLILKIFFFRRQWKFSNLLFSGGLMSYLISAHTNPFLYNFVGMMVIVVFLIWWGAEAADHESHLFEHPR